jgi:hypothetical protein
MNDHERGYALYKEIRKRIVHLFEGENTAVINSALSELMVDVALNARPDKTRSDAMAMLGQAMADAAALRRS